MAIVISAVFIFILSLFLAVRSLKELETPEEIKKLMKKKTPGGVILFFKKRIVHYTSAK